MRVLAVSLVLLVACAPHAQPPAAGDDARYAAVQTRGAEVMGVDQYSSTHRFDDLADGGLITFTRNDPSDSEGIAVILAHLQSVADSFTRGVFVDPATVHGMTVPGTGTMTRKREQIRYQVTPRADGGALRIQTRDTEALAAIHEFMAFQRSDHRAAGHQGHQMSEH